MSSTLFRIASLGFRFQVKLCRDELSPILHPTHFNPSRNLAAPQIAGNRRASPPRLAQNRTLGSRSAVRARKDPALIPSGRSGPITGIDPVRRVASSVSPHEVKLTGPRAGPHELIPCVRGPPQALPRTASAKRHIGPTLQDRDHAATKRRLSPSLRPCRDERKMTEGTLSRDNPFGGDRSGTLL